MVFESQCIKYCETCNIFPLLQLHPLWREKTLWYKLHALHGDMLRGPILPLTRQLSKMQNHPSETGPGLLHNEIKYKQASTEEEFGSNLVQFLVVLGLHDQVLLAGRLHGWLL